MKNQNRYSTEANHNYIYRIFETFLYSIMFSIVIAFLSLLFRESMKEIPLLQTLLDRILICLLFFGTPLFFSLSKSNKFLIKDLSFDQHHIVIKYYKYGKYNELKSPLESIEIKLVQWYYRNSIYLKIDHENVKIKQYAGVGWTSSELRKIYKDLSEIQRKTRGS